MSTLKLLTNALKINNACFIRCSIQMKQQQLRCLKRVTDYTPAEFIRNSGGTGISTIICCNKDCFRHNSLLSPQLHSNVCTPLHYLACYGFGTNISPDRISKTLAKTASIPEDIIFPQNQKLGVLDKFKLMYKRYWYVLIPVHVITSAAWICGFYYLTKSGVDVPALLQHLHLSETTLEKVKSSNLGHWAIAYLCFKVVTPLRYAVTLGGTTISIKYLVKHGYIKPMPTKDELVRMYEKKKAHRAAVKAHDKKEQQDSQNK